MSQVSASERGPVCSRRGYADRGYIIQRTQRTQTGGILPNSRGENFANANESAVLSSAATLESHFRLAFCKLDAKSICDSILAKSSRAI